MFSHVNKTNFNHKDISISQKRPTFDRLQNDVFASFVRRMGEIVSLTAVADLDPPGSPNIKVRQFINLMMPSLREFVVKPEAPRATRAPHYVNHS